MTSKKELSFEIIGKPFYPKDRLSELEETPRLSNGDIDYWKAAKLLCEKDGGELPSKEQLQELANVIYGENVGISKVFLLGKIDEVNKAITDYGFINNGDLPCPWFTVWSKLENLSNDYSAYGRGFGYYRTDWVGSSRNRTYLQAFCVKEKSKDNNIDNNSKYDLTDDGTGKKYDTGKPMVGTLCRVFPRALLAIGKCIEFGTHKYPQPDNWKLVDGAFTRYQDSMIRHYLKHLAGQTNDSETNLLHLSHMAWNALAILELYLMENKEENDGGLFI